MRLAVYVGMREGFAAVGTTLTRLGTKSKITHCEIVFEEKDGATIAGMVPDMTLAPTADNEYWSFGASSLDIMPFWSPRRVGSTGGVRLKRIAFNPNHWLFIDIDPAEVSALEIFNWLKSVEGAAYDWRHIGSFLGPVANLVFSHSTNKFTCGELIAAAFGFKEPERFSPALLYNVFHRMYYEYNQRTVRAILGDAYVDGNVH